MEAGGERGGRAAIGNEHHFICSCAYLQPAPGSGPPLQQRPRCIRAAALHSISAAGAAGAAGAAAAAAAAGIGPVVAVAGCTAVAGTAAAAAVPGVPSRVSQGLPLGRRGRQTWKRPVA